MFGQHFFVYMVRCVDGSLYTGVASDPDAAATEMNRGNGPAYPSTRTPVFLVYREEYMNERDAERRAHMIRRMGRAEKEHVLAMAHPVILEEYAFGA